MNDGNLMQTFQHLGSVLRLSAECRRELQTHDADWSGAMDAMSLLEDLNEHAARIIAKSGLVVEGGAPPERGSPAWRRALPLAA